MEHELSSPTPDSPLIISEKSDANVAQLIQEECDKQFADEPAVSDGEHEAPSQPAQDAEPQETTTPAQPQETPVEAVVSNGHAAEEPALTNGDEAVDSGVEVQTSTAPVIVEEIKASEEKEHAAPPSMVLVKKPPRVIDEEAKPELQKEALPSGPRKGAIATSMDTESVREAYNDIRADNSETRWAVFKYEASRIVCAAKGVDFEEFKGKFDDDERAYGYIRLETGDELSKRHKFLFVTWIGPGVSVLKRAKMSIDKAIIKNVVSNFAVELQLESLAEFDLDFFIESLNKASGANYGTGVRDI